ncbi:hypothetical protein SPRG_08744 [Saprolegnia parasitica CBS 223.65]|uniref:Uncharacterized protein n=1 Tax=Saprolegnia parasitica (strain CBS 223.65) TaxID=695850 RepID=A0A067CGY9_SAPPC|nr:hypothetical protein SPRG_08744 [Saprolegnia parasitica CBS 223.65]KDO25801.1 hypothetical protein SPRG_08744 [Saprolegnia parasitica CBS 223.65]|eukprot:XP_012203366.1 hypothetical protein SPRG_08744 [Saprolegnia parasitica CBS 223.65]
MELRCEWASSNGSGCHKTDWPACGYDWLVSVPVGVLWLVWLIYGGTRLLQTLSGFHFDAATIHDPIAQGMAIALSQRKSESRRRPRFQRYMKLGAMWAEWPSFMYTPLTIALKATGAERYVSPLASSLNLPTEAWNLGVVVFCGSVVLVLRVGASARNQTKWLRRYAYPLVFDTLYIPLVATLVRLGTCPTEFSHIALPNGATCDCVDAFGFFWAAGLTGFLLLYASALYYKMHIEPLATTMDFRFQPSFQIIMVMARTLNPILSMLVSDLDLRARRGIALLMGLGFLCCFVLLLVYTYTTQPCIGSGLLPNNIRFLSFSSAVYTTLVVLVVLVANADTTSLYIALTPLPLLWVLAWRHNTRRALHYHIPQQSILDLLCEPSPQAKTVGAIAALYVDATKLHPLELEPILAQLTRLAKRSRNKELLCRAFAIRILWFAHIKNFRKQKLCIGETQDDAVVPPKFWFKDVANPDRAQWTSKAMASRSRLSVVAASNAASKKRVKLHRIEQVLTVAAVAHDHAKAPATMSQTSGSRWSPFGTRLPQFLAPSSSRMYRVLVVAAASTQFEVVGIHDKHWISHIETPSDAVHEARALYNEAQELLAQSCAASDVNAMYEISVFLLQWYRSRYLKPSKTIYAHLLATLAGSVDRKLAMDATYTLYKLHMDDILPNDFWLRNVSHLNTFLTVLGHPSATTAYYAATVLNLVLEVAETDSKVNLFVLLTPESIASIQAAFRKWHDAYRLSAALEDTCLRLYNMEVAQRLLQQARRPSKRRPSSLVKWVTQQHKALRKSIAHIIVHTQETAQTRRSTVDLRKLPAMVQNAARYSSMPLMARQPLALPTNRRMISHGSDLPIQDTVDDYDKKAVPALNDDDANVTTPPKENPCQPCAEAPVEPTEYGRLLHNPDELIFVTRPILDEIHRRRTHRRAFERDLAHAFDNVEEAMTAHDVAVALAKAIPVLCDRYTSASQCAIGGFIESGIAPNLREFFETRDH